jgi:hypothetical protein
MDAQMQQTRASGFHALWRKSGRISTTDTVAPVPAHTYAPPSASRQQDRPRHWRHPIEPGARGKYWPDLLHRKRPPCHRCEADRGAPIAARPLSFGEINTRAV